MGGFADRLAELAITATSPDGGITAELRADEFVKVWFAPGAYRRYDVSTLSHQLARLATLLWTKYRREYMEVLEWHLGGLYDDGYERSEDRAYWQRLEQLVARGASAQGVVTLQSRALVSWEVEIARDALDSLNETEFVAELRAAATDLLADYRAQVVLLTDEVYGLGLPQWLRDRAAPDGQDARREAGQPWH